MLSLIVKRSQTKVYDSLRMGLSKLSFSVFPFSYLTPYIFTYQIVVCGYVNVQRKNKRKKVVAHRFAQYALTWQLQCSFGNLPAGV